MARSAAPRAMNAPVRGSSPSGGNAIHAATSSDRRGRHPAPAQRGERERCDRDGREGCTCPRRTRTPPGRPAPPRAAAPRGCRHRAQAPRRTTASRARRAGAAARRSAATARRAATAPGRWRAPAPSPAPERDQPRPSVIGSGGASIRAATSTIASPTAAVTVRTKRDCSRVRPAHGQKERARAVERASSRVNTASARVRSTATARRPVAGRPHARSARRDPGRRDARGRHRGDHDRAASPVGDAEGAPGRQRGRGEPGEPVPGQEQRAQQAAPAEAASALGHIRDGAPRDVGRPRRAWTRHAGRARSRPSRRARRAATPSRRRRTAAAAG